MHDVCAYLRVCVCLRVRVGFFLKWKFCGKSCIASKVDNLGPCSGFTGSHQVKCLAYRQERERDENDGLQKNFFASCYLRCNVSLKLKEMPVRPKGRSRVQGAGRSPEAPAIS